MLAFWPYTLTSPSTPRSPLTVIVFLSSNQVQSEGVDSLPMLAYLCRDQQFGCLQPSGNAAAQVTLFIGNLTEEWQDVDRLQEDLSQHGRVERAFIAHNAQGESKVLVTWHHSARYLFIVLQMGVQCSLYGRGRNILNVLTLPDLKHCAFI